MPIEILQVVRSQDVNISVSAYAGVVYDALCITAPEEALHGLQSIASLQRVHAVGGRAADVQI